ncbi:MAG: hypothetical protein ACK2U1_16400 [Anaerolineales bacterium]
MNRFFLRGWGVIFVLGVLFSVYGCKTTSQPTQGAQDANIQDISTATSATSPTLSPSPITSSKTATMIPATLTVSATPTFTDTPTDLPPTPTETATEAPPIANLFGYTVCRFGPGTIFPVHTSIREDRTALVRGRLDDERWYLIEFPESGETCWIFHEIIDIERTTASIPILTPPPTPTPAPAPTQSEEEKALGVKYFLIIPDNGGPFACGDGIAYFYSGKKGNGIEDDIKVALNALFSVKTEYVGNYYNPVYQSNLRVKSVSVEGGGATIRLRGTFVKPKSECESERIHTQVWQTASQFSEITKRPIIWVNNVLLGDLLESIQK